MSSRNASAPTFVLTTMMTITRWAGRTLSALAACAVLAVPMGRPAAAATDVSLLDLVETEFGFLSPVAFPEAQAVM